MATNREIHLVRRPELMPVEEDFALVETAVPEPQDGEVLVRNVYLSLDPYMRTRMTGIEARGAPYPPPYPLNEPMRGGAVGRVEASRHPQFAVGDWVSSRLGWREYFTSGARGLLPVDGEVASPSSYLGVLGMTGLTAYAGMLDVAKVQEGETVFVSAAAGAVGMAAGQIARTQGCRVVGSAGSEEKVRFLLDELGFDAAFNYRDGDIEGSLEAACPDGLDVYFDNVGGEHLQAAIGQLSAWGRVAICGMISQHREPKAGPNNLQLMTSKRITMQGFVVGDYLDRTAAFMRDVQGWLADGRMRNRETIVEGIEHAPSAFLGLWDGDNIGKLIVRVGPEA